MVSDFLHVVVKGLWLLVVCGVLSVPGAFAQAFDPYSLEYGTENPPLNKFRVILNKITLSVNSGYGHTFYNHDIPPTDALIERNGELILVPDAPASMGQGSQVIGVRNWLNNPSSENLIVSSEDQVFTTSDTETYSFAGEGKSVPLNLMLYGVIAKKFRIGAGFGLQYHSIRYLQEKNGLTPDYQADLSGLQTRWWIMGGYTIYEYWDYTFTGDFRVGKINRGGDFSKTQLDQGLTFNLGVTIDKNLSKYFRVFLRPSYDFGGYTALIPSGTDIRHRAPTVFLEFGISLNYPIMPRSPIKADHMQMEHVVNHPRTGKAMWVRGQPITKKQNPRVGENHPVLFKYKGKNKRKRNPY
ncbi:hypothetical protein AB9P05_19145 [Roseivirga sp. BDSF3-8]|uniref:hypothetical protein n=1 Tax=Roseivirga sp. BDSF3-8 TaxID=3241598 RepID=UPI00353267E9